MPRQCLAAASTCDADLQRCCPPHRCWRGPAGVAQCRLSCPVDMSWPCHAAPRVGLVVARWGGWPAWTPLLLKTLGATANASTGTNLTFLLVSEEHTHLAGARPSPSADEWSLDSRPAHRRRREASRSHRASASSAWAWKACGSRSGRSAAHSPMVAAARGWRRWTGPPSRRRGRRNHARTQSPHGAQNATRSCKQVLSTAKVSTAKTNDLKPLLGEALAGALAQFDWWGHLQVTHPACRQHASLLASIRVPFRRPDHALPHVVALRRTLCWGISAGDSRRRAPSPPPMSCRRLALRTTLRAS